MTNSLGKHAYPSRVTRCAQTLWWKVGICLMIIGQGCSSDGGHEPRDTNVSARGDGSVEAKGDGATQVDSMVANECIDGADCTNSEAARRIGRCAARDVYCNKGRCEATCRDACETVLVVSNACAGGLICNHAMRADRGNFYCTGLPISCDTTVDCPLYRPTTDAGISVDWTCVEGTCRYPGVLYLLE